MSTNYEITEVNTHKEKSEFIKLPARLYKKEANWIHPLNLDIESIFDPLKNKYFQHGECCRWILKNSRHETVGRVAAFVDNHTCNSNDQPTGGMGFFECINDINAAFKLFDTCKHWLRERNMEAMDGPINFGERHQWWGLLVKGFHRPNYAMPYNFAYYKTFFEKYGFKNYFEQYTYHTSFNPHNLNKIITWKANRIFKNPDYRVIHFKTQESSKFINDFVTIYNQAWTEDIPGVEGISKKQANSLFQSIRPVLVEKLIWFAYHKDQPIGFFIMMPDINQILRHLKGKINLWGKILFFYYKYIKKRQKALGIIFGIIPSFQSKGIESALITQFNKTGFDTRFPFKELEMNWIGDFNPRMMHLMELIGARVNKTHITYRKLFDPSAPFKRAQPIK